MARAFLLAGFIKRKYNRSFIFLSIIFIIERWGYRKISKCLNQSGIMTFRGRNWFSSSVISVLKRKHEHDLRIQQIRNQHFPNKVSKLEDNYYVFD